jgi:hypothetical protein
MDKIPVFVLTIVVCALFTSTAVGAGLAQSETVELTVELNVIDSGAPEEGTQVVAAWDDGNATRQTSGSGLVRYEVPRGSNVTLSLGSDAYVINQPRNVTNVDSDRRVTLEVSRPADLQIELRRSVSGARVELSQNNRVQSAGRTDRSGQWQSGPIEEGAYQLRISKPGYYNESRRVTIDGTTSETLSLREGVSTVTFDVRDATGPTERSVENATINVNNETTLRTSPNGTATTELPVNERVRITTTKQGFEPDSFIYRVPEMDETVEIITTRTPELNVTVANRNIPIGSTTTISVVDEYGEPVVGAEIILNNMSVANTDRNGTAQIRITERGTNQISVRTNATTSEPVSVTGVEPTTTTTRTETPSTNQSGTPASGSQTATPQTSSPTWGFLPDRLPSSIYGVGIGTILTGAGIALIVIVWLSLIRQ